MKRSLSLVVSFLAVCGLGLAKGHDEVPLRHVVATITLPALVPTATITSTNIPPPVHWVAVVPGKGLVPVTSNGRLVGNTDSAAATSLVRLIPLTEFARVQWPPQPTAESLADFVEQQAHLIEGTTWELTRKLPSVGFVRVLLRDPKGEPLRTTSVQVRLRHRPQYEAPTSYTEPVVEDTSDAEGAVNVALLPGWHQLLFVVPGKAYGATGLIQVKENALTQVATPPMVAFGRLEGTVAPGARHPNQSVLLGNTPLAVDSQGHFSKSELVPGSYSLRLDGVSYSSEVLAGSPTRITLPFQGSFFGRGLGFGGTPRTSPRTIQGSISDHNGKPVSDAQVFVQFGREFAAYSGPGGERGVGNIVSLATNRQGHFIFKGLPESYSTITVFARRPGGPLAVLERSGFAFFPWEKRSPFEKPFDLSLPARGESLTVAVLTPEGKPAVGKEVSLGSLRYDRGYFYPKGSKQDYFMQEPWATLIKLQAPRLTTSTRGTVRFTGLAPGMKEFVVLDEREKGLDIVERSSVTVMQGRDNRYTLRLSSPRTNTSIAVPAHATGKQVRLGYKVGSAEDRELSAGKSVSDNTYLFTQQRSGATHLWDYRSFEGAVWGGLPLFELGWRDQTSFLTTSLLKNAETFALTPVWHGPGVFRVQVLTAMGKRAAGVAVELKGERTGLRCWGTTDAQGAIVFPDLPEGHYAFQFLSESTPFELGQLRPRVRAGEEATLTLRLDAPDAPARRNEASRKWAGRPRRSVMVRCITPNGRPAYGAMVQPRSDSLSFGFIPGSDANGNGGAYFEGVPADEPVTFMAWLPGFTGVVTLAPRVKEATLVLRPLPLFQGKVTLWGKSLLTVAPGQVSVRIWDSTGRLVVTLQPQAEGTFEFALPRGKYKVQAVLEDIWFTPEQALHWDGTGSLLRLDLPRPGQSVWVTLKDKNGDPCSSVCLDRPTPHLTHDRESYPELRTDAHGRVRVDGLPAGKSRLRVRGSDAFVTVETLPSL